jgi:GNAT superfamily N-acetyltransferase
MSRSVADIEQAAFRAWPARGTVRYDGWQLRYGDGFSRRINSVAAEGASAIPIDEKLAYCRRWYAEHGLPLLFRITPVVEEGIDAALDGRGFGVEGRTVVMIHPAIPEFATAGVHVADAPTEAWITAELDLAGVERTQAAAWLSILDRIPEPAGFALIVSDGAPVAAGIGVLVDDWLGVFEVVVDSSQRRRGHARVLMEGLHAWAAERAAARSFLQVVVENRAAIGLFEHLGYEETYRYWYRRDPG